MGQIETLPICPSRELVVQLSKSSPFLLRPRNWVNQRECLIADPVQSGCQYPTITFNHEAIKKKRMIQVWKLIVVTRSAMDGLKVLDIGRNQIADHNRTCDFPNPTSVWPPLDAVPDPVPGWISICVVPPMVTAFGAAPPKNVGGDGGLPGYCAIVAT